ncbi:MAG TPA: catalase family protein [Burkholderiaceae bacterium]
MAHKELAQEYPPPGEETAIADLAARLQQKIRKQYPSGIMRRDAHPKMHGLVKAEFIVEPDLPREWRVGIFREPITYTAWIRFSNQSARIQSDLKGDIRGMAIKLMDVPGEKLLAPQQYCDTQDFMLISTNVFVTHDVGEFNTMVKALMAGRLPTAWFFATHWRAAWNLLAAMKKVGNPLAIRYWSATPYLFGSHAVKYSALPTGEVDNRIPAKAGKDFLRHALAEQLRRGEVRFDFAAQKQTDPDTMPIEDPGMAWSEAESPFVKLATIRIPQQDCDTKQQRHHGENLSFNPWHCLPQHRPLGGINRARRTAYHSVSTMRHERNLMPQDEP